MGDGAEAGFGMLGRAWMGEDQKRKCGKNGVGDVGTRGWRKMDRGKALQLVDGKGWEERAGWRREGD